MTEPYTTIRRFIFLLNSSGMMTRWDINDLRSDVLLSFVSSGLHLNVLNSGKMLQFGTKDSRRAFQRKRSILKSLEVRILLAFGLFTT